MTDYEFTRRPGQNLDALADGSPWEYYRNHREIITGFLQKFADPQAKSLCILARDSAEILT